MNDPGITWKRKAPASSGTCLLKPTRFVSSFRSNRTSIERTMKCPELVFSSAKVVARTNS